MQNIFALSAYETSAEQFFQKLKEEKADLVLDVRLKNSNQLCGFTKAKDLAYLIPAVTGAAYVHDLRFAPSAALLESYLKHQIGWEMYRASYLSEMKRHRAMDAFRVSYDSYQSICILGTSTRKRRSHSDALIDLITGREQ